MIPKMEFAWAGVNLKVRRSSTISRCHGPTPDAATEGDGLATTCDTLVTLCSQLRPDPQSTVNSQQSARNGMSDGAAICCRAYSSGTMKRCTDELYASLMVTEEPPPPPLPFSWPLPPTRNGPIEAGAELGTAWVRTDIGTRSPSAWIDAAERPKKGSGRAEPLGTTRYSRR